MATNNEAVRQLLIKLELEKQFIPHIGAAFNAEMVLYRQQVLRSGLLADPQEIMTIWLNTLNQHYNQVVPAFATAPGLDPLRSDILDARLQQFVNTNVQLDANAIARTSRKDMQLARHEAVIFLDTEKIPITPLTLDRVGTQTLRAKQSGRVTSIATTETQTAAEGSKEIAKKAEEKDEKVWITVQDNKVRAAHVFAHGQKRFIDQPFEVGGEALKHPGDSSLGASVKNVVNCRCSAIYG